VIPYEEYLTMSEALQEHVDRRCLCEAKETEKDAPTISPEAVKSFLKKSPARKRAKR
jgi:hypothetical protein